jgi:DNA-binding response OmpR family regulator
VARVKAVLRRITVPMEAVDEELEEELVLQDTQYVVSFRGTPMVLSKAEWTILVRLARTTGKVVPREELRAAVWGEDQLSHDRELDHTITSLSQKLSTQPGAQEMISGIAGTGYRLAKKLQPLPLSA